jgi:dTDP-4-dehydrorhamnose reductase
MTQPKILLIGKNGQVGWELRRTLAALGPLVPIDFPEVDLTDGASVRRWMRDTAPQIVVNAAAYTAVDKAEAETDLALKLNGVAPGLLAEEARRTGALLVHYSTDMVFDGAKNAPYVEEDSTNPLNAYGRTKLAGDHAIRQVDGAHLIFRLCWVYGARAQNFMLTMLKLAREREKLRVVRDQVSTPTWCRMIAEATALALKQVLGAGDWRACNGTYHLSAAGSASKHAFAEAIVRLMPPQSRKCKEVEAITTAEFPAPAPRAPYSALSCAKLEKTFGLRLPPWEESLQLAMEGL